MSYEPKKPRPTPHTAPLRDIVNMRFDIAIDAVDKADREQGRKLSFIMRKQNEELVQAQLWAKYNRCPSCHLTLTTSGRCHTCDYVKPKGACRTCAYKQEGQTCLNRKGCEGKRHTVVDLDRCDNWVKL